MCRLIAPAGDPAVELAGDGDDPLTSKQHLAAASTFREHLTGAARYTHNTHNFGAANRPCVKMISCPSSGAARLNLSPPPLFAFFLLCCISLSLNYNNFFNDLNSVF